MNGRRWSTDWANANNDLLTDHSYPFSTNDPVAFWFTFGTWGFGLRSDVFELFDLPMTLALIDLTNWPRIAVEFHRQLRSIYRSCRGHFFVSSWGSDWQRAISGQYTGHTHALTGNRYKTIDGVVFVFLPVSWNKNRWQRTTQTFLYIAGQCC